MRYLLLREGQVQGDEKGNPGLAPVVGFLSFMITVEDEMEVVYW